MTLNELASFVGEDISFNARIYALAVVPTLTLTLVVFPKLLEHRRIQPTKKPELRRMAHDLLWSMCSLLVFALMNVGVEYLARLGVVNISEAPVDEYGALPIATSAFGLILLHDAYFYWMHRIVHGRALYRLIHAVHHRSTAPTPLTSFAFHPLEAVLENSFFVLAVIFLPVHIYALLAWQVFQQFFNAIGHLGFEIFPSWWRSAPILGLKTTSTHHNLHHERFLGNYGLWFVWWDRWMGTEFADDEARFLQAAAPRGEERTGWKQSRSAPG